MKDCFYIPDLFVDLKDVSTLAVIPSPCTIAYTTLHLCKTCRSLAGGRLLTTSLARGHVHMYLPSINSVITCWLPQPVFVCAGPFMKAKGLLYSNCSGAGEKAVKVPNRGGNVSPLAHHQWQAACHPRECSCRPPSACSQAQKGCNTAEAR